MSTTLIGVAEASSVRIPEGGESRTCWGMSLPAREIGQALMEVADTLRWPSGELMLDLDPVVLSRHLAPALADRLRGQAR